MERRLTDERGGGVRREEKTRTRNGGVEEARSFKENGPILYFSRNGYLLLIPPPLEQENLPFMADFIAYCKGGTGRAACPHQ